MASVLKDRATPQNPLGIIALFVFFIEAIATVSLGLVVRQSYAIYLVWFIIFYPTFIALAFFVLLWVKREALYSPSDFRDDTTFRDILLRKVEVIEAKQDAARIDASTNVAEVIRTVDRLLSLGDIYSAVNVGRTYFKINEYDQALQLLDHLKKNVPAHHDTYYKVLANRAYALIALGRFDEAIAELERVRTINGGAKFYAWHGVALAYAHYRLAHTPEYRHWIEASKAMEGFASNKSFFRRLYPEIADDLQ
jgi:tetratricopeptide (TPR) repeat protein